MVTQIPETHSAVDVQPGEGTAQCTNPIFLDKTVEVRAAAVAGWGTPGLAGGSGPRARPAEDASRSVREQSSAPEHRRLPCGDGGIRIVASPKAVDRPMCCFFGHRPGSRAEYERASRRNVRCRTDNTRETVHRFASKRRGCVMRFSGVERKLVLGMGPDGPVAAKGVFRVSAQERPVGLHSGPGQRARVLNLVFRNDRPVRCSWRSRTASYSASQGVATRSGKCFEPIWSPGGA